VEKEEVSVERKYVAMVLVIALIVGLASAMYLYQIMNTSLDFTFMRTEELKITGIYFPSDSLAVIAVTDTGANSFTISGVTIDDSRQTAVYGSSIGTDGSLAKGASGTIIIYSWTWTSGYKYTFAVLTTSGNKYTYTTTAALSAAPPTPSPPLLLPSAPHTLSVDPFVAYITLVFIAGVMYLILMYFIVKSADKFSVEGTEKDAVEFRAPAYEDYKKRRLELLLKEEASMQEKHIVLTIALILGIIAGLASAIIWYQIVNLSPVFVFAILPPLKITNVTFPSGTSAVILSQILVHAL
jgi:hypothetical protein